MIRRSFDSAGSVAAGRERRRGLAARRCVLSDAATTNLQHDRRGLLTPQRLNLFLATVVSVMGLASKFGALDLESDFSVNVAFIFACLAQLLVTM